MNRTVTTSIMVFAFLFCSQAFAIKQVVYVSPNATTFRVEQQADGMVRFTIVREPADTPHRQTESIIPVRTAQLSVSTGKRVLLTAPIAPRVNDDGQLVYVFRVSEEHASGSVLSISENHSGYIGDGTIYNYSKSGVPPALQEALLKIFGKHPDRPKVDSRQ